MTDGTIGIDEPSTIDKRLDAEALTVGSTAVLRERVQIAGTSDTAIAPVSATTGLTVDPVDRALRDLGKVDIAESDIAAAAGMFVRVTDGTETALVTAGGLLQVDGSGATQPISAASLPLPAGAATAALQLPNSHDVTIDNAAGASAVNIQDGGNAITVDGTVTAAAQPGVDIGDVTVNNGAGAAAVNIQDGGNSITVDQGVAGTAWEVIGDVAHDAPVVTNPVAIGGRGSDVVPTEVSADGDLTHVWVNRQGALVTTMLQHIALDGSPYTLTSETAQYTTTQTGVALWTPSAGKKLIITYFQIQAGGTTAGTMQLWFGAAADTTYTRGTDLAIFDGEWAPSATLKPGIAQSGQWIAQAADHVLRVTDSAAINPLTVTVWGYEI